MAFSCRMGGAEIANSKEFNSMEFLLDCLNAYIYLPFLSCDLIFCKNVLEKKHPIHISQCHT